MNTIKRLAATGAGLLAFALALLAVPAAAQNSGVQPTVQARAVSPVQVLGELIDLRRAFDGRPDTRAYAGADDYANRYVLVDIGGQQNIIGVIQDHGRWPTHYPGRYRVEVGPNPNGPWTAAFEGSGQRGESKAMFRPVRGRYVQITALDNTVRGADWSLAEIKVVIDPGQTPPGRPGQGPRPQPQQPQPQQPLPPQFPAGDLQDLRLMIDGRVDTRATSGRPNYAGMSFTFDLGGEYQISRVALLQGQWEQDFPAEFRVEVSRQRNEDAFREVWRGRGTPGRSVATFEPRATRYIRVTALQARPTGQWWSIAELRTNRDEEVVERDEGDRRADRPVVQVTGRGLNNLNALVNPNNTTRVSTNRTNYIGSFIVLDMGGSYTISRVVQVHNPDDNHFAGRYQVEVSEDGRTWRQVFEGRGESGRSRATFEPVRARYVRITATDDRQGRQPWSVYKVRAAG